MMDKTLQYTQVIANFDSAYNIPPKSTPYSTTYSPMSLSTSFAPPFSNRSSSPLFHRSISPPPRRPISTGAGPKFNFDLYKMDENNNEYTGYSSPSYRSLSPSSPRIIHHYPIHSPLSSPVSKPGTASKLRQINDELCCTLARSELNDQPSSSPPHYHIHHYPLSQQSYPKHRSRSRSEERRPPIELEVSPKIHKARVTYKIHVPRRHRHRKSSRRRSTSDESSRDEPVVVDLYPTRDQGFAREIRQDYDNQNPWIVSGKSIRRNSYSDTRISRPPRTPKDAYYDDKPIKLYPRSNRDKERPSSSTHRQSPYVTSRMRPDSAPFDASDQFYQSTGSFSDTAPVWRSSGSITPSKTRGPVWQPSSKTISKKPPKYFAPTSNPDYDSSARRRVNDEIESEPMSQRKPSDRVQIRSSDPKLRKRIQNTESKIKPMWQPTVTGFTGSTVKKSKPSKYDDSTGKQVIDETESEPTSERKTSDREKISSGDPKLRKPLQNAESKVKPTVADLTQSTVKERTPITSPKSKVKSAPPKPTSPTKSVDESTPRNQNDTHDNDDSADDLFANESHTSEPSKKPELSRPPPPVEKKPTPQQPSAEPPKTTVPEPDKGTKSTIKNGVLVRGNDTRNRDPTPSPRSEGNETASTAQPKSNNKDSESVVDDDDDRDENDEEVARSFDFNKWLNGASTAILGPSKNGAVGIPSTPPRPAPVSAPASAPAKPKAKSPPRRKGQPSSPPADEDIYKPPFGPKKTNPKPSTSPPPPTTTTTGATADVDDFFT